MHRLRADVLMNRVLLWVIVAHIEMAEGVSDSLVWLSVFFVCMNVVKFLLEWGRS